MDKVFNPNENLIGGYSSFDGTIEFYGRINALLKPDFRVLDYGAGRGAWFFEDTCEYRREFRDLKSKTREVIGVDIDPAVLSNPTTSHNICIDPQAALIPIEDESIDLIICSYVLEHLSLKDLAFLKRESERILKKGGYFCARTPHYWHYVCAISRLSWKSSHSRLLKIVQPNREKQDVFPAHYRCNTLRDVNRLFPDWQSFSYIYVPEPGYFMNSQLVFIALFLLHKWAPSIFTGNLFIYLVKT